MSHTVPDLAVCQRLTAAIGRSSRLEDICTAALVALGDGLQVERSAIQLFDADGVLRFKASRGVSDGWLRSVEGSAPWTRGQADAYMVVLPDLTQEAAVARPLSAAIQDHVAATAFLPLVTVDGVIGTLMLWYDSPPALSTEEQQLATIIAAEVALALERTTAQLALSESEQRLRSALDAANIGTWDWDIGAQRLQWSPTLEQIHGAAPGTFDGTFASYERDIHPDDRMRVLTSTQRAVTDGTPHEVEYRIVTADGTVRWVEGKGRVQHDADGNPTRMTGICMNVTARKEAELARLDALEHSRRLSQRLAAIVESSDDAIIGADLDGVITSWNRGAERMFNFTADDAIGQPLTLTVPPELHRAQLDLFARVRSGESLAVETVRCRRDGSALDIALTASPLKDATGRIVGASQISRDISTRKRHDAEFADLYGRLTKLINASARLLDSPDAESVRSATLAIAHELLQADGYAVWRADRPDGEWQAVKTEGLSSGFSSKIVVLPGDAVRAVLLTNPIWMDSIADSMPLLDHRRSVYLEEGIQSLLVCPMRLRGSTTGTLVFYYRSPHTFSAVEVQTAQALANLAAAAMMAAELYDEQRAQREAAEAVSRQTAFLAKVGALLAQSLEYENTLSSVVQLAVPEICDSCAVHLVGQDGTLECLASAGVESGPGLPDRPDPASEVVLTGQPVMYSVVQQGPDQAPTSYMCVPLSTSGRVLGTMTFVHQESGRHFQDRDLQFAQEVAGRAATAVTNAHAYRRVHEANRLKDEFLATLSHELRTPLNAILGYAQMLNLGLLDGERRTRAVTVLARNADALKQIIDDVLDVSRITAGKLRLNVQPGDLASIVHAAIATVQPAADAKQIVVTATIDPEVPKIAADADRLQQVLWNLLSNAVKFTPPGGAVTVSLRQTTLGLDVAVADTGRGIDPSFLPHVFDRFRQGDSRFSREHGGLGLGLSIARELAELHGGHVSVSSAGVGSGATFTLHLPRGTAYQGTAAAPASVILPIAGDMAVPGVRLDGICVLVVDDEDDALQLVREILESAGSHVLTAPSALSALEVLRTERPDMLITDIGMPHMDGLELIRSVRRTLEAPINAIPAAALTAYARPEDRTQALASGFQMHIAKPVNPVDLIVAVAALTRASDS